jgi:hypothetical protein
VASRKLKSKHGGTLRTCLRWTLRAALLVALLLAIVFVIVCHKALYERLYRLPRQAQALTTLRALRSAPTLADGWNEYRGVLHAHSELSHDSAVTQTAAVRAAKAAEVDFFCMTDHYVDGKADYALGWNGPVDGVLFIRGFELSHGLLAWGVPAGTVFQATDEPRDLARRIHALGAVVFFAHCEQERLWDLPELDGMEIYNLHTDFQDEDMRALFPRLLLCLRAYPELTMRLIFDPPRPLLARWDHLNQDRHITGIAANDAHQNVGLRLTCSPRGTLVLQNTGEKTEIIREVPLNRLARLLLRPFSGPLEPGREVFRLELDPYERSCRFVNTHVLARDCTEPEIVAALRAGRAFVAFSMLADARGFTCLVRDGQRTAVIGESLPFTPGLRLQAAAPLPCRFLVYRDGVRVQQAEGRQLDAPIEQPGHYRVEAELQVLDEWVPWIYANPIAVEPATPPAGRAP